MNDFNSDDRKNVDFAPSQPSFIKRLVSAVFNAVDDYVLGLDVNHWRPNLNVKTAKQQLIRFIITKATQGNYLFDTSYEHYRDESKARGLPFGAFHYWDAKIDPVSQAKYFFDHVGDDIDLLPILDVEKYGNKGVLSQSAAAQHIHDTLLEIERLFERDAMIYTNRDSWTVLTGDSPIIAEFALWVASWTTASSPVLPIGAIGWVFWQFTNQFSIPNDSAKYDANRFHGNEAEFEVYVRSLSGLPPVDCCEEMKAELARIESEYKSEIARLEVEVNVNKVEIHNLQQSDVETEVRLAQVELQGADRETRLSGVESFIQSITDAVCK